MKKQLLLSFLLIILCSLTGYSQDIILKTNGEEIKAKVVEIGLTSVLFKLPESTQDSLHTLARAEVFMITFANGTKEVLQADTTQAKAEPLTPTQMALLGKKEAKQFYKPTGVLAASALATWVFWPAVVGMAVIPPKVKPSQVSNATYLTDPNYLRAYKSQAQKRKLGQVAIGTGVGIVTLSAVMVVMLTQMGN